MLLINKVESWDLWEIVSVLKTMMGVSFTHISGDVRLPLQFFKLSSFIMGCL